MDKQQQLENFFNKQSKWQTSYLAFREILKEKELEEDYKWMHPCYTLSGKNVVLMHGFKSYAALLFHKGALIEDKYNMLIQQTENVQSARQLRFEDVDEIISKIPQINWYIDEAIKIELSGKKIEKKQAEIIVPEEMLSTFAEDKAYEEHFYKLTPGRQRAYIIEINKAKKSETKINRIKKYRDKIMLGKGIME
ncbi:YdhG-like domain-containing protein [Macrococcoides canis]|uniref:YdhG-like domain-containing protein n=1 Tax=Macrococcoides canis TaxID=1855823 RepID=A0A1W7A909_9STAP|nr:DUF1801 domain-containing protein [Macrococcus canis]ARQ05876.1 hypothetical protein MCCS_02050 [Macrococcus canis]WBF52753.1 YdeI/OmpD-associated family protein [Macrococcus canis]